MSQMTLFVSAVDGNLRCGGHREPLTDRFGDPATWPEMTSVPKRFRRLFDSTSMLYCAACSSINLSLQIPVSNPSSGLTMFDADGVCGPLQRGDYRQPG